DYTKKLIVSLFTVHEFSHGRNFIVKTLEEEKIKASFFITGDFYRNKVFKNIITRLKNDGNYLGPHSDKHVLYCDWNKRDSLLVTKKEFSTDLKNNYAAISSYGKDLAKNKYFLPP